MGRRVVLSGIGVVSANGVGKNAFWTGMLAAASNLHATEQRAGSAPARAAFRAQDWFASHADAWLLSQDRFVQLGVVAARLAMHDAAVEGSLPASNDAGLLDASASAAASTKRTAWQPVSRYRPVTPRSVRGHSRALRASSEAYPSSVVAAEYGLSGPCISLSGGCTGGLDAFGLAFDHVQSGDSVMMLAAASDVPVWTPRGAATLGTICDLHLPMEGAATLVLEDLEHALQREARIYAEVLSFATAGGPRTLSGAFSGALERAALTPPAVDYVDLHGCSDDLDAAVAELERMLGPEPNAVAGAALPACGYPWAAAGLMGVVASIGAIKLSVFPPSAASRVRASVHPRRVDVALVAASATGRGHSAALLRRMVSHA